MVGSPASRQDATPFGIRALAFLACLVSTLAGSPLFAQQAAPPDGGPLVPLAIPADLVAAAQRDGTVRVIVRVAPAVQPEGLVTAAVAQLQRQAIAGAQDLLVQRLAGTNARVIRRFQTIPFVAFELDAAALTALTLTPGVTAIEEDRLASPVLDESVPLVHAPGAWSAGTDGDGWTIAVLDTGVDAGHPFLAGKVVAEACFSSVGCPGGGTSQFGAGAGAPCAFAPSTCRHGTHVAGIAAGTSADFSGVARAARLMAVQVFSRFTGPSCQNAGEDPCALAFTSDIIGGLEHVYTLGSVLSIAAVNLSLGSGAYSSQSTCDAQNGSTKAVIDNLSSIGIATVIASGNAGRPTALSAPACISSAVSVGSTTKSLEVSSFSNSAPYLALLAPGSSIHSSVPGGSFAVFNGTSMAAPHVAGAWAILKQRAPAAAVASVLNALRTTGVPVVDSRNGVVTPFIQIFEALSEVSPLNLTLADTRVREGDGEPANANFTVTLSGPSASTVTAHFATVAGTMATHRTSDPGVIQIPDAGHATPYPSMLRIGPGQGPIRRLAVRLKSVTHPRARDLGVLLVGPSGETVVLMAGVGGAAPLSGTMLTFDDAGPIVPVAGPVVTGTYHPSVTGSTDIFESPAPPGPYGFSLSAFAGSDPVGEWRLFVTDSATGESGSLSGDWSLIVSTDSGDFTSVSGTVTLPPGATIATVAVPIAGDEFVEPSESFVLRLSNPTGANIVDGAATGTIVNDDFTDRVLAGVTMKTTHVFELRSAINDARESKGLPAYPFSDLLLSSQWTPVRAVHIAELRLAIVEAYAAAGLRLPAFSDEPLVPGLTPVRAVHISELREAVANLP